MTVLFIYELLLNIQMELYQLAPMACLLLHSRLYHKSWLHALHQIKDGAGYKYLQKYHAETSVFFATENMVEYESKQASREAIKHHISQKCERIPCKKSVVKSFLVKKRLSDRSSLRFSRNIQGNCTIEHLRTAASSDPFTEVTNRSLCYFKSKMCQE